MEEDKFARELREGAIRNRLPKAEDFDLEDTPSFAPKEGEDIGKEVIETDMPQHYEESVDTKEGGGNSVWNQNHKKLLDQVWQLHKEGKEIEDIYDLLKEQGYSYQEIEEAIYELVRKEKQHVEREEIPKNIEAEKQEDVKKPQIEEIPTTEQKEQIKEKVREEPAQISPKVVIREFAPLFVKLDKYNETIETLGNLRNYLIGMSKLFELANELEKVRANHISAINKMYNKINETASKLYMGLLKPRGMKIEGAEESQAEIEKLNEILSNLNKELSILRDEIDRIKSAE